MNKSDKVSRVKKAILASHSAFQDWMTEWHPALRLEWWDVLEQRRVKPRYSNLIMISFFILEVFFMIYLVITRIKNQVNSPYVSLENTNSDQTCNQVPSPIVGTFNADYNGRWSTSGAYTSYLSIFQLIVPGALVTVNDYQAMIQGFDKDFRVVGERAASRGRWFSLAAWTAMYSSDSKTHIQFASTVLPQLAFQFADAYSFPPMNKLDLCEEGMTFDFSTGAPQRVPINPQDPKYIPLEGLIPFAPSGQTFTYSVYLSKSGYYNWASDTFGYDYNQTDIGPCPDHFTPFGTFLYPIGDSKLNSGPNATNAMSFTFDMRSILIASAVNMGIIPISKLTQVLVRTSTNQSEYGLDNMGLYTHPRHLPMAPLQCQKAGTIYNNSINQQQILSADSCFVLANQFESYGGDFYPFVMDVNSDGNVCNCTSSDYACKQGNFRISLFYTKQLTDYPLLELADRFANLIKADPINGDLAQRNLVRNLYTSCTGSTSAACSSAWTTLAPNNGLSDLLSLFTIDTFLPQNAVITNNGLTLDELVPPDPIRPSCANSIYRPDVFQRLGKSVPVPLEQPYFSCVPKVGSTIIDSIGNAFGFVMLFVNLALVLVVVIMLWWDKKEEHHVSFWKNNEDDEKAQYEGNRRKGHVGTTAPNDSHSENDKGKLNYNVIDGRVYPTQSQKELILDEVS